MDLISMINNLVNIIGIKMSEVSADAYLGVFGVVLGFILSKYFSHTGKEKIYLRKTKIDYSDKYPSGNALKVTDTKKVYVIQLTIEAYNTKEKLSNLKKCTIYAIPSVKKIIRNGIDPNYFKNIISNTFQRNAFTVYVFCKDDYVKRNERFYLVYKFYGQRIPRIKRIRE